MRLTPAVEALIDKLFDAITGNNCLTHEDIATTARIPVSDVGLALTAIRDPRIAKQYGWTVPHAPRGRPGPTETKRYIVVGLSGETLDDEDIRLIRRGDLSTMKHVFSMCRNEAYALKTSIPAAVDRQYKRRAKTMSQILEGVAAQAEMEIQRLAAET